MLAGVEHDPGTEPVAEPVGQVAQAAEVLGADSLCGLDLNADHGTGCVLQHHVHLHLVAVTVVEELHGLFGPGELARDLADREVLQQWPDRGSRVLARSSDMPMSLPPSPESVTISFGVDIARVVRFDDHAGMRLITKTSSSRSR